MTPEEQRIAIAEHCGWTHQGEEVLCENHVSGKPFKVHTNFLGRIPNYTLDLNAMNDAEKFLNEEESDSYMSLISHSHHPRAPDEVIRWNPRDWALTHATASQRAEAFLKSIGKWETKLLQE